MRAFTTGRAAGKALRWVRKGTTLKVQWVEYNVENSIDSERELAKKAVQATIEFVNLPTSFMLLLI